MPYFDTFWIEMIVTLGWTIWYAGCVDDGVVAAGYYWGRYKIVAIL